jgi:hypothetical protein
LKEFLQILFATICTPAVLWQAEFTNCAAINLPNVTSIDGKHKMCEIMLYHEIMPVSYINLKNQCQTLVLFDNSDNINSSPKTAPTWISNKRHSLENIYLNILKHNSNCFCCQFIRFVTWNVLKEFFIFKN